MKRGNDGKLFNEAGVFFGFEIVNEEVGKEELLAEVLVELVGVEFFVAAERGRLRLQRGLRGRAKRVCRRLLVNQHRA